MEDAVENLAQALAAYELIMKAHWRMVAEVGATHPSLGKYVQELNDQKAKLAEAFREAVGTALQESAEPRREPRKKARVGTPKKLYAVVCQSGAICSYSATDSMMSPSYDAIFEDWAEAEVVATFHDKGTAPRSCGPHRISEYGLLQTFSEAAASLAPEENSERS